MAGRSRRRSRGWGPARRGALTNGRAQPQAVAGLGPRPPRRAYKRRLGMDILRTLVLVCIAAWLAISAFFPFAVAPLAFRVIDRAVAGQLVAAVLPRYYDWGVALCAIALIASAVQAVSGRRPHGRALAGAGLCALMLGLLLWASIVVLPRAESARRARDDGAFALAHRASVQLNGLTLLAGAAVLLLETFSRSPRRDR